MKKLTTLVFAFAMILKMTPTVAETLTSVGEVYDVKTNDLIYREFHVFNKTPLNESMHTTYKDIDGQVIAQRTVNFNAGFAANYVFQQPGLGIEKRVNRKSKSITYTEINAEKSTVKTFEPKNISTAVVNAGMFNAIDRAWPKLSKGETIEIDLVVPERGRTFKMLVEKVDIEKTDSVKFLERNELTVFKMRIANRFLRLLVPPIELGYSTNTKRLTYYQGPSNIRKPNNKAYKEIRVIYSND